ncbi:MAG TPA: protein-disulfide reductase DsbD domain-containing protein [Vicinamibacterales bacterium]|nr:protein-disulfide reductase DsbD domain-containing protein [Vicinamibacterales bacterium]
MKKLGIAVALLLTAATLSAQTGRPQATVTPLVISNTRLALRVTLPEGLHTQSNKPRDPSLIPTELTIDTPPGVSVDEIVWPPPQDLKQEGLDQLLAVFEHEFFIGVQLKPAAPADARITAHLRYQACDEHLCYPPKTAEVDWAFDKPGSDAELKAAAAQIKFGTGAATAERGPRVPAKPDRGAAGASNDAVAKLDQFAVLGTAGGYLPAKDFLSFIHDAEIGVKQRGMFEGRGPLMILLLVFIGGLALNLTPCVLPMIPINLAIIGAGTQAGIGAGFPSKRRGFILGLAYGSAMAVVYGVLGVIVILTAGSFGTINSSPWFNAGIAILFVVLALAMFDVIIIDFSSWSSRFTPGAKTGTFVMAFTMGAVAALLAGACVAPVVIQVVLFSSNLYAGGTKIALGLPFFLGLGMAVPWPIAGAGIASLPKPGMWMVRVKQAFGVFILATAVYYGYQSYELFANRWVDASAVASAVQDQLKAGWQPSLGEGLDTAVREGKPVLIDMWATWCKNCLTMDKTTLENADVESALKDYVKIKFQAEDPDSPPASTVMKKFDAVGLPAYVILKPKAASYADRQTPAGSEARTTR